MDQDRVETGEFDQTLGQDVRQIIGGVLGITLIVVPIILIRKLVKALEESDTFGSISRTLKSL